MLSYLLSALTWLLIATNPDPLPPGKTTLNKTLVLRMVNDIRSKGCQCGDTYYPPVAALIWNDQLESAALAHSVDMEQKNYFSHNAPNGDNAGERIDRAGYKWLAFGENIGMGYRDEAEVIAAWKSSPGHCKNLMAKKFAEMAVARSGKYWVQTFGNKKTPNP